MLILKNVFQNFPSKQQQAKLAQKEVFLPARTTIFMSNIKTKNNIYKYFWIKFSKKKKRINNCSMKT